MQLRNGKTTTFQANTSRNQRKMENTPIHVNTFITEIQTMMDEVMEWEPISAYIHGLREIYEYIAEKYNSVCGQWSTTQSAFIEKIRTEIPPLIIALERYLVNPIYDGFQEDMKKLENIASRVHDMIA